MLNSMPNRNLRKATAVCPPRAILLLAACSWIVASSPAVAGSPSPAPRTQDYASQWQPLIQKKAWDEARALCQSWLSTTSLQARVEAHKCLSNVDINTADRGPCIDGSKAGGHLGTCFVGKKADDAIEHLNQAVKLAPQDLSIHQGRLYILLRSQRANEMPKVLASSLETYKGPDALEEWVGYGAELCERGSLQIGIPYFMALARHYPNDHTVEGDLGAALARAKRDKEAEAHLRGAAQLAPKDATDAWNLANFLEVTGRLEQADPLYQHAIELETDPAQRREDTCLYAKFLELKRKQPDKACPLEQSSCDKSQQTACQKKE